jgi:hypothetical protein
MNRGAAGTLGLVLLLAGCGGGSKPYDKADLPDLILSTADAPAGTKPNRKNMGVDFLEREGGNEQFFSLLRPFGFVADAGVEFYGRKTGVFYAESLAFVFKDADGAAKALAAIHRAVPRLGQNVEDIAAPGFGDESWGVSGTFAPKSPPGYFYFWRVRNALIAFTMSGSPATVTAERTRLAAETLPR